MSEIYEKIGSGINKIQGTIQSSQNRSQLKKTIQEASLKRTEILVGLGEEVYKKLRAGEIESEDLRIKAGTLMELDHNIYLAQQAIAILNASEPNPICPACGAQIAEGDKFCGGCGNKIEMPNQVTSGPLKQCPACDERIPEIASFCNCCGTKLI